jgi:hypothetical protein
MMSRFLVELYAPGEVGVHPLTPDRPGACGSIEEDLVRYVGSLVIPGDETCFHIFDASSLEAVRDAMERASTRFERIVPVIQLDEGGDR